MRRGWFGRVVAVVGVAASIALGAGSALALPEFTVDEGAVPGSFAIEVTADRFNYQFNSAGTQTIGGGDFSGSDDPFTENGSARVSGLFLGAGNGVSVQLTEALAPAAGEGTPPEPPFATALYGMYALFHGTGESDPIGAADGSDGILGIFDTFTITLHLDPLRNTVHDANGNVTSGGADDILLGTGVLTDPSLCAPALSCGITHTFSPPAQGDFGVFTTFTLDPGQSYFIAPQPFYVLLKVTGVSTLITPISATETANFGSGDGFFAVSTPEPASIMLLGLGLVGLTAAARRMRKVA